MLACASQADDHRTIEPRRASRLARPRSARPELGLVGAPKPLRLLAEFSADGPQRGAGLLGCARQPAMVTLGGKVGCHRAQLRGYRVGAVPKRPGVALGDRPGAAVDPRRILLVGVASSRPEPGPQIRLSWLACLTGHTLSLAAWPHPAHARPDLQQLGLLPVPPRSASPPGGGLARHRLC